MQKTITVQTEGGAVVVRKLALGDYAALLKALKKLPQELSQFVDRTDTAELKDLDFQGLLPKLPEILGESIPEFAEILAIGSDKDADFYLKGDLADAIDVFAGLVEVNDFARVMASAKKLTARKNAAADEANKQPKKSR